MFRFGIYCDKHPTRDRVAGQAMTDSECESCNTVVTYGSTATELLCADCSNNLGRCRECGIVITVASAIKLLREDLEWPDEVAALEVIVSGLDALSAEVDRLNEHIADHKYDTFAIRELKADNEGLLHSVKYQAGEIAKIGALKDQLKNHHVKKSYHDKKFTEWESICAQQAAEISRIMNPWVNVVERLPDDRESVLIFSASEPTPIVAHRMFNKWFDYFEREEYSMKSITHWMSIPK